MRPWDGAGEKGLMLEVRLNETGVVTGTKAGKGRRQNSSVAFGDFLQRMTNVGWQGFAAQLHPYHMLG